MTIDDILAMPIQEANARLEAARDHWLATHTVADALGIVLLVVVVWCGFGIAGTLLRVLADVVRALLRWRAARTRKTNAG